MPQTNPPLATVLPSLICGTATFNNLYNSSADAVPTTAIVHRALDLGVRAFDTSPYYGPSESLLGAALADPACPVPRSSYHILTKVGRIAGEEFDYSPAWVRYSVQRSLQRLCTPWLDVVYCHDVEFVSPEEVIAAVQELRRIRDENGTIKYIGISGYPVPLLCELAERILKETGEPLDIVQSYANFTLQNTTLESEGLARLKQAKVSVVPNASVLGMGLLRGRGVPIGGKGDFHPAGKELREKVQEAARWVEGKGEKLEVLAIRWGLEKWAYAGATVGGLDGIGVSVMGVSNLEELEETMKVWSSVLDGLPNREESVEKEDKEWSVSRKREVDELVEGIWKILGKWKDYVWASPDEGYVNKRMVMGVPNDVIPIPAIENGSKPITL